MSVPKKRVYLDYNASSPVHPEVINHISDALNVQGNPSSVHSDGREARRLVEEAREAVAALVRVSPKTLTFVSGGTEANSTIISAFKNTHSASSVLGSEIEHPSVLVHIPQGQRVPVNEHGLIDLAEVENAARMQSTPFLFCVMLANNETGVVQPVNEVVDLVHKYNGLVLCDAVQGLAKLPLHLPDLGADFYTFSGHKIGGPKGTGCIVVPNETAYSPSIIGGGQERGKRAGTENVPGIRGFGAAAKIVAEQAHIYQDNTMRDQLETALTQARSDAIIIGQDALRLPNTTNIALPGTPSGRQIIKLDLAGFSVSAGSACSSGKVEPSHVLVAMGLSTDVAESAIRISIGPDVEWADLERFVTEWSTL